MACACCGPPKCCTKGYPVVVVNVTGLASGIEWGGQPSCTFACATMNGSYVFQLEENPPGGFGAPYRSALRQIRNACTYIRYPGAPGEILITEPPVVGWVDLYANCKGVIGRVVVGLTWDSRTDLNAAAPIDFFSTWVWPANRVVQEVDPDDGCVKSATYPPVTVQARPTRPYWDLVCKNTCTGDAWGDGEFYGGPMYVSATVTR